MRQRSTSRFAAVVLVMGTLNLLTPPPVSADPPDCTVCVDPSCPSLATQNEMCHSGNCGDSRDDCKGAGSRCEGWDYEFHCAYGQS